jgi:hypothetical protein
MARRNANVSAVQLRLKGAPLIAVITVLRFYDAI